MHTVTGCGWLGHSCVEEDPRSYWIIRWPWCSNVPLQQKSTKTSWAVLQVKPGRQWSFPSLQHLGDCLWSFCPALDSPGQRHWYTGGNPAEGHHSNPSVLLGAKHVIYKRYIRNIIKELDSFKFKRGDRDLIALYDYVTRRFREDRDRLFSDTHYNSMRVKRQKQKHGKF